MSLTPQPATAGSLDVENTFYTIIGRFVTSYAAAEAAAHVAARTTLGISDDHARVLFGGMRLSDLGEKLRKISSSHPEKSEIDNLLSQLSLIGKQRDKIAHRFMYIDQDAVPPEAVVSNHWNAKSAAGAEEHGYTYTDLASMLVDCNNIMMRFMCVAHGKSTIINEIGDLFPDPFSPWRYTLPPQAHKRPKRP